jgi:hypothetical protein
MKIIKNLNNLVDWRTWANPVNDFNKPKIMRALHYSRIRTSELLVWEDEAALRPP